MREIDPNLEDFFRERFDDFESEPLPESWSAIQDRLHKKRRRPVAIWWSAGIGIAATLLAFLWWFPSSKSDIQNPTQNVVTNDATDKTTPSKEEKSINQNDIKIFENNQNVVIESNSNDKKENIFEKNKTTTQKHFYKNANKNQNVIVEKSNVFDDKDIVTENISTSASILDNTNKNNSANNEDLAMFFLPTLMKEIEISDKNILAVSKNSYLKNTTPVKEQKDNKQLAYNINFAPTYHFRNLKMNTTDDVFIKNIKNPSTTSAQRLGLQGEMKVTLTKNKWSVFSGINYQYLPLHLSYDVRKNEDPTIKSTGSGTSFNVDAVNYATEAQTLQKAQHNLSLIGGVGFSLAPKTNVQVGAGIGRWIGKSDFNGNTVFATAAVSQKIGKIYLTPFARYDLGYYEHKNNLFSIQPYQIGLKVGL